MYYQPHQTKNKQPEGRLIVKNVPGSHHLHLDEATCTVDGVIEPTIAFLLESPAAASAPAAAGADKAAEGGGKL
jgi:hypothetical protein